MGWEVKILPSFPQSRFYLFLGENVYELVQVMSFHPNLEVNKSNFLFQRWFP